jgi:hypothetical protein
MKGVSLGDKPVGVGGRKKWVVGVNVIKVHCIYYENSIIKPNKNC